MIGRVTMMGIAIVMLVTLGGCITIVDNKTNDGAPVSEDRRMAEEDNIPVHGETPGQVCRTEGLSGYVGRPATAEMGAEILHKSNAARLRWIRPNDAVTTDYRRDRINVKLSETIVITGFSCG